MKQKERVAVLGSGSWATAIAKLLLNNVDHIHWYIRDKESIKYFKEHHHNHKYLSSVQFDTNKISFYNNITETIKNADIIIIAIPSPFLEKSLSSYNGTFEKKYIVSAVKGIVPIHNLTIAEFFNQMYAVPFSQIGILTGPCHAEEIALERLSYLTIASKCKTDAQHVANMLGCHYCKTKLSKDIYGIEYASVLKNIVAIASGICHGLGYGDNFQAVLVSNATQEIKRFLDTTYRSKRKINSSAYLGDLLVTTYSQFSRNRTFGNMIGKGYSIKAAQLEMNMIAEGFYAVDCIKEINENFKVDMPIINAVYHILHDRISPVLEIQLLTDKLK